MKRLSYLVFMGILMKNIIIAGASKGVGKKLIEHFKNDHILALARSFDSSCVDTETIKYIKCDLTNFSELKSVIDNHFEKVDLLINCAATWTGGNKVRDIDPVSMHKSLELNFFSVFNPTKICLEKNYSKDRPLKIINLGATASTRGGDSVFEFAAGKSLVRIMSQSIAREMSKEGVHCCHLIIDGLIYNKRTIGLNPGMNEDEYIQMSSIVSMIDYIADQPIDCWTHEIDLRNCHEKF